MNWAALNVDELKAAIGKDRAKMRAAVAALAAACAQPGADPKAIGAKLAAVRGLLTPGGAGAKTSLSRDQGVSAGPGRTGVLVFSVPGARPFEAVGNGWFRKEIVHAGTWTHPGDGEEVDFPPQRLEAIARTTNSFLNAVGRIPYPDGHNYEDAANNGWWHALEYDPSDETLYGLVEVPDPAKAARIGKESRDVSMVLSPKEVDSYGNEYSDVITHVCATSYPVIPDQKNFTPLELSRSGARPQKEDSMALSEKALKALGLSKDAKPEEIEAAIAKLADSDGDGDEKPGKTALARFTELEKTVKTQADEIQLARKAIADRDTADLETLVSETSGAIAAAGVPAAFAKDRQDRVKALWQKGEKEAARDLCALAKDAAGVRALPPEKSTPAVQLGREEAKNQRLDELDTRAALAQERGNAVSWAKKDGTRCRADAAERYSATIHPTAAQRREEPQIQPLVLKLEG